MSGKDEELIALSSMSLGQKGLIVAFSFDVDGVQRVEKMGLFPGEQLEIVRLPPLGDPIEIKIRGYFLSLPKQEADHIMVKLFQ
jgi:Fe2+ transport system protein FeoA